MPAPAGNKFAEKWDLPTTIKLFESMGKHLKNDETIMFWGTLCAKEGVYKDLVNYLADKFSNDEDVFRLIKEMHTAIESRLVEKGIKGLTNATMTIFTLKNHYGWKDTIHNENKNDNREIPNSIEELDAEIERIRKETEGA